MNTEQQHVGPIVPDRVVGVLLADGWHRTVTGSFTIVPFEFAGYDSIVGYRFHEQDDASPYPPATLAGPLTAVLAIRQIGDTAAVRRPGTVAAGPDGWSHTGPQSTRRAPHRGAAA
jgi:hypothetical protein